MLLFGLIAVIQSIDDGRRLSSLCTNTCDFGPRIGMANDGVCQDAGDGSVIATCDLGTDCDDCGPRNADKISRATSYVERTSIEGGPWPTGGEWTLNGGGFASLDVGVAKCELTADAETTAADALLAGLEVVSVASCNSLLAPIQLVDDQRIQCQMESAVRVSDSVSEQPCDATYGKLVDD